MATLNAPGVSITEIDKSGYSPAMAGTRVYITGYSSKGELYKPMNFSSRAAWLSYYGEPDNEAERYFYTACMEVINQGGTLYCARLPYLNDSLEKYAAKKYKVSTKLEGITKLYDGYIDKHEQIKFMDGQFAQFGLGISEKDAAYAEKVAVSTTDNIVDTVDQINEGDNLDIVAYDYYYSETPYISNDNDWLAFKQTSIYKRMKALFDQDSTFTTKYKEAWEVEESKLVDTSSFDETYLSAVASPSVDDYISAFMQAYADVFGESANAYFPWRFDYSQLNDRDNVLKTFFEDNEELFENILENINPSNENASDISSDYYYDNETPYIFWSESNKCNLIGIYSALRGMTGSLGNKPLYWKEANSIIAIYKALTETSASKKFLPDEVQNHDDAVAFVEFMDENVAAGGLDPAKTYKASDNELAKNQILVNAATLYTKLNRVLAIPEYQKIMADLLKNACTDTVFAKKCLDYFVENVQITGTWDLIGLKAYKNIGILYKRPKDDTSEASQKASSFDEAGDDAAYETFFAKYCPGRFAGQNLTEQVWSLLCETAAQLSKNEFVNCIEDIRNPEDEARKTLLAPVIEQMKTKYPTDFAYFATYDMLQANKWSELREEDDSIDKYYSIDSKTEEFLVDLNSVTEWEADETRVPQNSFYIIDKTNGAYSKAFKPDGKRHECVGIIPVITTAANALKAQKIIEVDSKVDVINKDEQEMVNDLQFGLYECLSSVATLKVTNEDGTVKYPETYISADSESTIQYYTNDPTANETVSQQAAAMFPSIDSTDNGLARDNMKKIGVVVYKAYLDASEGNKISYELVEAYAGELDRNAKNPQTGATAFIDSLVNSQSEYIYFFSNCFASNAAKEQYTKECDILTIEPQKAASLGFYEKMVVEDISLTTSILQGLNKCYEKVSDINEREIDIVVDAGISNIAQYIYTVFGPGGKGAYDPTSTEAAMYKMKNRDSIKMWKTILLDYFDNFCKRTRKDCMFVADCPRPFALTGNKKIVRPTKPSNTIDANLLPYVTYMAGINTNFGAGYCDWFQVTDEFSGDYFWCPPSIKAAGIYIYTDENFHYWNAPAGLNRGIVSALDVAFSPTNKQAGEIYQKNWNYAIYYPNDGIVLEGQKTFQTKPSALDRVNVRRLCLRLERQCAKILRYFVYEQNTAYMRQRVVDMLTPDFASCKAQGGLYDFYIRCNDVNNTPTTIDRNELHIDVCIKPSKTAEFIYVNFVLASTGMTWEEALG